MPRLDARPLLLLLAVAGCAPASPPAGTVAPAGTAAAGTTLLAGERPRPYPVEETPAFQRAVAKGTRTRTGQPGPRYWQQFTRYDLAASYAPATGRLDGTAGIRYFNRSPDTLKTLAVQLHDNIFAPEAMRNRRIPITEPVAVEEVRVRGQVVGERPAPGSPSRRTVGTVMYLLMQQQPLLPGDSIDLAFRWSLQVPPDGAPRGGRTDEVAWVSYWYPQMAVYDDVVGWHVDQYLGRAEFHMGFGDYDVAITVPEGYLVAATGELVNAAEVLTPAQRERLAQAAAGDEVVHVVGADEVRARRAAAAGGSATWRFRARNVRDMAFGTSARWAWDATRARTGDGDRTTAIHAFWVVPDSGSSTWQEEAAYARHSIEFLSRYLWPYPYPHATAIQGPGSCGGMEFPMITCIGAGPRGDLYGVTVHELAHVWFPMQVASDEKRHSWQDEGLTEFNQVQGEKDFYASRGVAAPRDFERLVRDQYLGIVKAGLEEPLMRHGDYYENEAARGVAAYMKPAAILMMLRTMLGEETFLQAYRTYGREWQYRHPKPYDLWNTVERVSRRDLDWFWRTWFYETWALDHAVGAVSRQGGGWQVVIEDKGMAPMPVPVRITRADGTTEEQVVPVEAWLRGARSYTLAVKGGADVLKVEIDAAGQYPDVDRDNNTWAAPAAR